MSQPTSFPTIRTQIAGVSVLDLAAEFGTPVFVYDAATIVARIEDLRAFDVIRYAQKACSNLAILNLVRQNGVRVDAVSAGEIHRALAAGYPPGGHSPEGEHPQIVYCADLFDAEALDLVVQHGLHVNCGSPDMIDQLGRRAPGREISLRINPGFGHGHSQKTNTGGDQAKHGIWHDQLDECLLRAKKYELTVTGLHVHIGSGSDLEHLSQVCGALERSALRAGPAVKSISVGGGLPVPYRDGESYVDLDAYYRLCNESRNRLQNAFAHPVGLEIEPGRFLAAECGYLVAEIRAVKRQAENLFYLVDAGFNDLARPILYGAYHPISITPADGNTQRPEVDCIVGGPLCESGDIFTQREGGFVETRRLPEARVGDLLVIECAGAYGSVMSSNYNSRFRAAEVLLENQTPRLIRRRQTFDELIAAERIPQP